MSIYLAHKTSCGNPDFYQKCKVASDFAPFLKDILEAGATLKGITICDEFFYSLIGENGHYGTPTNLNAPGCVPGGSSSGSAAALTTNLHDFSLFAFLDHSVFNLLRWKCRASTQTYGRGESLEMPKD